MPISYNDYKKKYKKEIEEKREKERQQRAVRVETEKKANTKKTTVGSKIKNTFSSFDDGYDFGDVTKSILKLGGLARNTVTSAVTNVGIGLGEKLEGLYDFTYDTSSRVNEKLLNVFGGTTDAEYKKRREKAQDWVKRDLIKEGAEKVGIGEDFYSYLDKNSLITRENIGGQVAQGVGGMIPEIALAMATGGTSAVGSTAGLTGKALWLQRGKNIGKSMLATAPSNVVLGTGVYGQSIEEAYKQGATDEEAMYYGIGKSAVEIATEWISGGIPGTKGTGLIDDLVAKNFIDRSTKSITKEGTKELVKSIEKAGFRMIGEAGEEALAEIIDPFLKNATFSEGETIDWEQVIESAIVGGITGGVLNASTTVSDVKNARAVTSLETEIGKLNTKLRNTENKTEQNQLRNEIDKLRNEINRRTAEEDIAPVQTQEETAPTQEQVNVQQIENPEQEIENIDNQIAVLEEQLMATENDAEYERLSKQIRELEEKANQLEQQGIAPVKMASVEETNQPTAQQTKSNLATEVESNTQNNTKNQISDGLAKEIQNKTLKANENKADVKIVSTDEVVPNARNGGYRTQEQIDSLTNDIKQNGIVTPIEVKVENGKVEVVNGHHRLKIAKDLGVKEIPVKYVNQNMENIDNSQEVLYNNENKESLNYVEGEFESGNRNRSDINESNVRVEANEENSVNNNVTLENEGTTRGNDKVSNEVQRDNDRPSSDSTSKQNVTPTQEELDNLEYTRKNKSGSEYASAFYDLGKKYGTANLYKGLNNYKSTGKALDSDIAPIRQELAEMTKELVKTVKDTTKQVTELKKELKEVKTSVSEVIEETKALTEADLPFIEQIQKEAPNQDIAPIRNNLTEEESQELDALEDSPFDLTEEEQARMEELQSEERVTPEEEATTEVDDPFKNRDYENIKNHKKSFQEENPEVKPFFKEMAQYMLNDLNSSQKGQRMIIGDISQVGGGNFEFSGQKRHTTSDIASLLDSRYGYSYDDIRTGLEAIINDEKAQNKAISKRLEFDLNERLLNGYTDITGQYIPPNQKYRSLLKTKQWNDYFDSIPNNDIALVNKQYEAIEPAPAEDFDNDGSMLRVSPEMEQKTLNKNIEKKNVNWEALEDTSTGEQQRLKVKQLGETLTPNNKDLGMLEDTSKGKQQQYNTETEQIEDSIEKKTKKQIKQELLEKTGIMNVSLDEANRLPKILMENTDPIRLQEMIFGQGLGTDINNMFFQKVKDNTSEKIRFQNKERAEIKALGIKARSKESSAVQKYGEKQWTNETTGETLPYGDKELASEFPNVETQKKIKHASEVIRNKYDKYLEETNKVLTSLGYDAIPKRKDYMRHFHELKDIFSRLGIPYNYNEMTANDLPTDINGLTADFSPSKNFFASTLQRKGNKTTYDAITGVDGYLEGIGNLIYHTEDIQRLRAFEQYIRDTYGENHGFDNLEKLTTEEKVQRIEKIQDNHLSNYASWLHEYTNTLAGKKALIDRSVEGLTGRKIYSFINTTKTQVGRNMIGFNLSSAMTNAIAGVQSLAKTNKLASVKGLADTVKNIFVKDGFAEKNNFLTSRFGSDRLSKNLWQRMGDAGFVFMQGTDNFISNFVVRSKYNELKSKGFTDEQAHIEAGKYASRLMSDRSQGATANIYNSQTLGLVTQFQNEVNNQLYSMFYDTYHESKESAKGNALKTAAGMTYTLGQMAVFTHLFGKAFESMAGYNPTFDIIGIFMKALGLDDEEDEEETTTKNISQAFNQLVDALPYVNIITGGGRVPVSEAFTGVSDTFKALTGGKDQYGQDVSWEDALTSIKESVPYFLLPSGYSQIKKTTKGLGMYDEDLPIAGSYTDSGNLRFTVEEDNWSKIQAGLFGQWANDEAQEYVDSDFKTINKNNIEELIDLGMTSSEYRKYRTGLSEQKKIGDKIDYVGGLDVTDEQKNIMANNILDRDYDVDMSIYDNFGSYEEFDYYYKYPEKYALGSAIANDFKSYLSYEDHIWDLKADKDENGDSITGTRKTKVIEYVNSLDLSIPQKAMLIRKEYSSFDDYNYEIIDYIDSLDRPYDEKVSILKSLDMEVLEDGTIKWK